MRLAHAVADHFSSSNGKSGMAQFFFTVHVAVAVAKAEPEG